MEKITSVHHTHADRQWDMRFNVQTNEYLKEITEAIMLDYADGKLKYVLVGGIEIGTRPNQDDYQIRHIHVGAIWHNHITKSAILKRWNIKEGNGYYMVPRNRDLPYSGWRSHHIKEFSKLDKTQTIIYENGELPKDQGEKRKIERSSAEKKETTAEVLKEIRRLLEEGKDEDAWTKYPRNYLIYGERIKSMVNQRRDMNKKEFNPHIWIYGFPGTGKTTLMQLLYPKMYKKDLNNRFFDLYNDKEHTHIMLEDLDHANVEKLGIQFIKTLCDEGGFPIGEWRLCKDGLKHRQYDGQYLIERDFGLVDQKYKTPQMTKSTCLVTSNFTINDVVPEGKGVDETKAALYRRFMEVRVDVLQQYLGVKLIPKYERNMLRQSGENNVRKLFMDWDYLRNAPTGEELKTTEEYQQLLRIAYFHTK